MIDSEIYDEAVRVLEACRAAGLTVATVESCTGGLVAAALTAVAGSSDVVDRGFVTYTDEAKSELVGVPAGLFARVGAVSEEVARAMAAGGLERSRADIAVGITGVAGPGQSENKPAGLVHVSAARRGGGTVHERCMFEGDRAAVRRASVLKAFELIRRLA
ncbi:MAG: CinA family protein [Rhodospirillaceae bacterium]